MTPGGLFGALGTEIVWLVVLTGFALIAAIVPAVLALQRRAVAAPLLALGATLAALLVLSLGRLPLWGWPPAAPEQLRLAHTTFAVVNLAAPLTFGPVAAISLALLAFAGARGTPRRWAGAGLVAALALLVAGIVAWGGWAGDNPIYAVIRAAVYVGLGLLAATAALAGGEPREGGPDAGAAAAAIFALAVAIGEASERGLVMLLLLQTAPSVQPADWGRLVDALLAVVATEWTASRAALAVASLVPLVGVAVGWRSRHRALALAGALVAIALAWAVLLLSDRGPEALAPLAALCGGGG